MPLLLVQAYAPFTASAAEAWLLGVMSAALLYVVIWSHEMGHIAAGWHYRIRTDLITLSPLGGVAHLGAPVSSPREDLFVTLAGPATHLLWLAVFWPLHALLPARILDLDGFAACPIVFAVWYLKVVNLSLLLFNLLPIFPLDGGRTLRALLSLRWHPNLATMWATAVGIGGGIVLCGLALWQPRLESSVGLVIGLSCITASLNERRVARHVLIYGQTAASRMPWEGDPDAWKRGSDAWTNAAHEKERRAGWFTRWRRQRAEQKAAARAADAAALEREVDAILERVHQVGMTGLTDREKAVLKRASQRRRETG
jgi:Zn-dependent protease